MQQNRVGRGHVQVHIGAGMIDGWSHHQVDDECRENEVLHSRDRATL